MKRENPEGRPVSKRSISYPDTARIAPDNARSLQRSGRRDRIAEVKPTFTGTTLSVCPTNWDLCLRPRN